MCCGLTLTIISLKKPKHELIEIHFNVRKGLEMKIIAQCAVNTTVQRNNDILVSETVYIDRNFEAKGFIYANVHNLKMQDAFYEILNTQNTQISDDIYHLTFVPGTKAFIDGKKAFSHLTKTEHERMAKYLINQCINGVIQAESYIYADRGFISKEQYNLFWDKIEKDGCRLCRYPSPEDKRWMDYIPQKNREKTLFNRHKTSTIIKRENTLECISVFIDSYHELNLIIYCNAKTGIISDCEIEYSRAPGAACYTNKTHSYKLKGKSIYKLTKKEILSFFGFSEGCYHLVEMASDICRILSEHINDKAF